VLVEQQLVRRRRQLQEPPSDGLHQHGLPDVHEQQLLVAALGRDLELLGAHLVHLELQLLPERLQRHEQQQRRKLLRLQQRQLLGLQQRQLLRLQQRRFFGQRRRRRGLIARVHPIPPP
jgi:hypothetical protein